jgi:hypothetical protein
VADAGPEATDLDAAVERVLGTVPGDPGGFLRALVLIGMMARRGFEGTLVIGLDPGPDFTSHAWVECDGRPLSADDVDAFHRLLSR